MPTVQFQATVTGDHFPNTVTPGAAHRRCRLHRATESYTELQGAYIVHDSPSEQHIPEKTLLDYTKMWSNLKKVVM